MGTTELVIDGALDVGLCWGVELLGRGVFGMLDDELELELEIVPLRGACEVDNEGLCRTELDSELTLELKLEDELGLGDELGDGLGLADELGLGLGLRLGDGV